MRRAVFVMVAWVFLFGCDDAPKPQTLDMINLGDGEIRVDKRSPGCGGTTVEGEYVEGNKGKVKLWIEDPFAPLAIDLFIVLALAAAGYAVTGRERAKVGPL